MASIGSTVCIYVLLVLYLVPDFARTSFVTTFPLHRSLRRMPIAHDRKITKDVQVFPDSNRIAYFVNVTIGNPAQDVTLCLDTGSGNLAVFSSLCKGCNSRCVRISFVRKWGAWELENDHHVSPGVIGCQAIFGNACVGTVKCTLLEPPELLCGLLVSLVENARAKRLLTARKCDL